MSRVIEIQARRKARRKIWYSLYRVFVFFAGLSSSDQNIAISPEYAPRKNMPNEMEYK